MRRAAGLAAVAAVLVALTASGGAAAQHHGQVDLLAAVRQIERQHPFSGSVLVARNGRPLLATTFGYADRGHRRPTRPDTRYRISGLTTSFTWIGLLQLHDRGRFDLDASVCMVVHPCPRAWGSLTAHHLMALRSGLQPVRRADLRAWPPTLAQYVEVLARKPLFFRPGAQIAHNASPYYGGASPDILAARLLELVSHQSWTDYVRERILWPARMSSTGFATSPRDAVGYGRSRSGAVVARPLPTPSVLPPVDLGIWSTVGDFVRFDAALRGGRLLSTASLAELETPVEAGDRRRGRGPSCCWIVTRWFGHAANITGAHGSGDGFYTVLERFPGDAVVTLVFTNLGGSGVFPAADLLSVFALGEYPTPAPVVPAALTALEGSYGDAGLQVVLRVVRGRLTVTRGFGPLPGLLIPTSDSVFVPTYAPTLELSFARDPSGRGSSLTIRNAADGSWRTTLPRR